MLQTKNSWDLDELVNYWEEHFGVIYQSKQSYYNLLLAAGIKWGGIKNWQTTEKALRPHTERLSVPRIIHEENANFFQPGT